jgi:5-formyltetrahydrofolate cyclo-ligase
VHLLAARQLKCSHLQPEKVALIVSLPPDGLTGRKRRLRLQIARQRAGLSDADRAQAAQLLATAGAAVAGQRAARSVACYASVGDEPPTGPLIESLLARGVRVLLPVVRADGLLDWAEPERGLLQPGPFGLLEPTGVRQGPAALGSVDLALLPALAVDRNGWRLGRGGGYIDRALRAGRPRLALAVVYDGELLEQVPAGGSDSPVDGALRPSGAILAGPPEGALDYPSGIGDN